MSLKINRPGQVRLRVNASPHCSMPNISLIAWVIEEEFGVRYHPAIETRRGAAFLHSGFRRSKRLYRLGCNRSNRGRMQHLLREVWQGSARPALPLFACFRQPLRRAAPALAPPPSQALQVGYSVNEVRTFFA